MARLVARAEIRFGLDDRAAGANAIELGNENLTEEIARHQACVA
jgi:hypothetical protein